MLYLIHQQLFWLLITAIAAGVAGWAWHKWRDEESDRLDAEREGLLKDLVSLVEGGVDSGAADASRDADAQRALVMMRDGRIAELQRQVEQLRASNGDAQARIAELSRGGVSNEHAEELARLRAEAEAHQREQQRVIDVIAEPQDPDRARWRIRFLESRVKHLEGQAAASPLAADLSAAQTRIAELESALEAAPHGASADDLNRYRWQTRYLDARVRYLEGPDAGAPVRAPLDANEEEEAKRRRWRTRYLETRLAHLDERADAMRLAHDTREAELVAARDGQAQRVGEMSARAALAETGLAAERAARAEADQQRRRLGWRARYLDARVRHLEERLARAPEPAAAAPQPLADDAEEAAPAPLVPPGREERPQALPAARSGAPDDLTLIDGVSPMQQSTLHSLGVFHFDQIAAWTPANLAWVDQYLRLRGRMSRERWVEQASALARGEIRARRLVEREDA